MALLGGLYPHGTSGSWHVKYGDEAAGTFERNNFTITEYGTSARAKAAALAWQKSKQPKWNKIVVDRAKAVEAKYNSLIKDMSADGRVPNKPFNKLNYNQKSLVKTELWKRATLYGKTTYEDIIIGGEKFNLPTSLIQERGMGVDNYKKAIRLLQKWKKNPTPENLTNLYFGKTDQGTQAVLRNFKKYLKGEPVQYGRGGGPTTQIIESLDLKNFLGEENAEVFKTTEPQRLGASRNLAEIIKTRNPLTTGTNDFESIIQTINKYKWNDNLTNFQNRGEILNSLKNNQVIIDRFKGQGEVLNNTNLIKRISGAHTRILGDAFQDMKSASLKNLSENQLQSYLKFAQNYFPEVNRGMAQTILENLKGADLKAAKTKLRLYGKLRNFLQTELGATGGALGKAFLQFDHPLSLAALRKTGNIVGALNVNPIQGDLNIWKRRLDLRLNALSKIDEKTGRLNPKNIEPLRALNKVNKVLFGKLGGDFTVTDQGIKIKSFGADPFLEANLIKGLKKNIELKGELVKSFDTIDKSIWDKIGIKDRGIFRERLMATENINVDAFKSGILKWTQENPKWTKILKGSVGCLRRGAWGGGRIGLQVGGVASDVCLIKKIDENPNQIVKAFRSLPGAGKIGAIGAALGRFGPAAGKYGAIAAVGALAQPLVKEFFNDDPSTYLTDENQQAGMLEALIEGERPKPRSEILDTATTVGALGATAAAVPGTGAVWKARRLPTLERAGMGMPRAALGPVMKFISGAYTPAGLLAHEPLRIAQMRREGESWGEVAKSPTLWMGPAFADTMTRMATRGMRPGSTLSKALSLGMSRPMLKTISRKFGMPGLALSLGLSGYDTYQDYKKKRGFFARDEE